MSIRNIIDSNIIESAVSGMVIYFFGDWDFLLKAILVLVILDFITGWIIAIYHHNLSSDIGFKGVIKKIVIFIVIVLANIIQGLLNQKIPLRETVIMFYIFNESLSILENAAYFIPIPKKLKETLKQLKEHEDLLR